MGAHSTQHLTRVRWKMGESTYRVDVRSFPLKRGRGLTKRKANKLQVPCSPLVRVGANPDADLRPHLRELSGGRRTIAVGNLECTTAGRDEHLTTCLIFKMDKTVPGQAAWWGRRPRSSYPASVLCLSPSYTCTVCLSHPDKASSSGC